MSVAQRRRRDGGANLRGQGAMALRAASRTIFSGFFSSASVSGLAAEAGLSGGKSGRCSEGGLRKTTGEPLI